MFLSFESWRENEESQNDFATATDRYDVLRGEFSPFDDYPEEAYHPEFGLYQEGATSPCYPNYKKTPASEIPF